MRMNSLESLNRLNKSINLNSSLDHEWNTSTWLQCQRELVFTLIRFQSSYSIHIRFIRKIKMWKRGENRCTVSAVAHVMYTRQKIRTRFARTITTVWWIILSVIKRSAVTNPSTSRHTKSSMLLLIG